MLVRKQCSFSWFMRKQTCDKTHESIIYTPNGRPFVPHNIVCISAKKLTVYKTVQQVSQKSLTLMHTMLYLQFLNM